MVRLIHTFAVDIVDVMTTGANPGNASPYEMRTGNPPPINRLRSFGSTVYFKDGEGKQGASVGVWLG